MYDTLRILSPRVREDLRKPDVIIRDDEQPVAEFVDGEALRSAAGLGW